ncbi:MAG: manganese efflux pump MntP family protein [Victivallaceae bacterium]|nr:manganese efflux pump MntP family protein [Victivallaceae bacterium]
MTIWTIIEAVLLGIGLAMDAFGVSVTLGVVENERYNWQKILLSSSLFGFFQFLMPVAGFFGGTLCGTLIQFYGRFIAAALLIGIGVKMIRDRDEKSSISTSFDALFILAVATSVDAFVVGVSFACLGYTSLYIESAIIGVVTFLIALGGALAGKRGRKHLSPDKAMIAGGCVLILLGIKNFF